LGIAGACRPGFFYGKNGIFFEKTLSISIKALLRIKDKTVQRWIWCVNWGKKLKIEY